ncbi:hypothetical protein G4O51_12050 [Candidatus Bathyarchaeota archaeon A05DMB-2]|jgi:DNA replicative helicase MCM subunit Mcm2 (Cdc46/Mcm family)|nr:hypothetical protein [Candidatus Bathyarchaeota archaeon A05DMB-2]
MVKQAQIPKRIYAVFTCSVCGQDFEKEITDYSVTRHRKYGTATVNVYARNPNPVCYYCLNKLGIDGVVQKLRELEAA